MHFSLTIIWYLDLIKILKINNGVSSKLEINV